MTINRQFLLNIVVMFSFTSTCLAKQAAGGGVGGGGGPATNVLSITWSTTAVQPNDKLSTIRLAITGMANPGISTSEITPHQASIQSQNMEVGVSGQTSYAMSGSGTTSGELNSNTESTFTIFSENLESAFASTHRTHANNTLIVNLSNRELKPGGGGYVACTAYIGLRLRLGGSPVNPFGAPFASNSFAQGSMPKIEGYFEHQQAFNGTLVVAWSFRVVNPDGEIETHSSTDPGRPLNLLPSVFTETTMLFNETNDTQIPNYSFILPEVFSLDNQSSLTTAMSGFGVGGSISSGYCSAGVSSSSFFAWNSPRKSPSINYLCQFALALTPVVFHGIYQW